MRTLIAVVLFATSSFAATPEIEALIEQLGNKDESVRLKAAKELGRLKEKAKDAIPALTTAITDKDEDVRTVAKKSLAAIKDAVNIVEKPKVPENVQVLIADLNSKDNKVKLAALAKLETLGQEAAPAAAAIVELGMMSPNVGVRDAANTVFEKLDPAVYKEIVTVYYDQDIAKKDAAVEKLEAIGFKAVAAAPVLRSYYTILAAVKRGHVPSRLTVLKALVKIDGKGLATKSIIFQVAALSDKALYLFDIPESFMPRRTIILDLLNALDIEDSEKATPIVSAFIVSGYPEHRKYAIEMLGGLEMEGKDKVAALIKVLQVGRAERALIIDEIGKLGADAKSAIPLLKTLKTDKDDAVRTAVTEALDAIKD